MLTSGTSMGGRYQLSERIASGGMGDVWKAEDTVLGRTVAVKVLQPAMLEEPGFAQRFRAEARVMATINHPGVVQVYDYGENSVDGGGSVAYLVMEYVEGEPLNQVLSNVGRLTPARTMDLIAQAADALQAAHERGIVHRDVKPGNLLVRPDGKLVLTDFGIARSAITGNLTQVGSVLGTASYVSPEQASGKGSITPASDVYSLGVVAYQCLAGRRPFEGESPIEVAMKHINEEPPRLPADVPDNVRTVVIRAMAKDVAARWPSARGMAEAARAAAAGRPVSGGPLGGTAVLPASRGTAVTPGGLAPTSPAQGGVAPTSPARGGQFARGAAAVPFFASQGQEEYAQATAGQQANQAGGGYQATQIRSGNFAQHGRGGYAQGAGYSQGGTAQKSNSGMVLGIAGGVLALLLLGGLLMFLMDPDDGGSGGAGETQTEATSAAADTVKINEADYLRKPVEQAKKELKALGLNPVTEIRNRHGYKPYQVTGVKPKGDVKRGTTVTIFYQQEDRGPVVPAPDDDDDTGDGDWTPPAATTAPPATSAPPPSPTRTPASPPVTTGGTARAMTDDGQKEFSG
ncbi:MAG TPA: serine/threonine protein kinase [Micromonosporaceae bacterium]